MAAASGNPTAMGRALEGLAQRYQMDAALEMDPLAMARRYSDPWDQEVAAWVAAHLAYGRVAPMLRAIEAGLAPLGATPASRLREGEEARLREELQASLHGWIWRFHTAQDLIEWILVWRRLDQESGHQGLEPHLVPGPGQSGDDRLSALVGRLRRELPATHGIRFMLPDPGSGSACKRWRLFLRWMVRSPWPDLGLWKHYPASELVIPLDTHVARISGYLGLTARKTMDGRMAREITDALRQADPLDPLRFDFALAHLGILGDCPEPRREASCALCPMSRVCQASLWGHKKSQ